MEQELKYYLNEDIKNTPRVFPMQGRCEYERFDMNENPEGLPKDFVDAVLTEVTPKFLAMYPEPRGFIKKYAELLGVGEENISATNGSDMAIRYILESFGERGKDVVGVSPSFEMYRIHCSILGLNYKAVEYEKDLSFDFQKLLSSIDENTRIVSMLNPNMPIGNVYTEEQVRLAISKAGEVNALVVIDEAYHYFYPDSFLSLAEEFDNVLILRTFSKFFSMAGCRLGVVIGNPSLIKHLNQAKLSFDANAFALLFAERLLDRKDIIERMVESEKEGKGYALGELEKRGYVVPESNGNYLLVKTKKAPKEVFEELKEQKILVHTYSNPVIKDYIRISTGSKRAMEKVLPAFFKADC